ncbi:MULTISPECIES: hypothetical protein [unclassified Francisella]|uniref:hypothetical protein n=1 Tax=unclassified Francisella TaxID=2610885 RepID=UPI002E360F9A|nr:MULTISPECIES: hypothetical protein [unclassified Francisella]MED7819458.1 hypothetical protein [Francisella sp. 19S2-4]MED7830247.1 hypothetical protein [Francisella sp. 19S2-10]
MKKLLLSTLIIILFLSASYSAEKDYMGMSKDQVKNSIQTMKVFDASLTYPYPIWFSTGLVGDVYRDQKGGGFLYEQIPTGQKFDSWNEIYTIASIYDKEGKISVSQYQAFILNGFSSSCNHNIKVLNAVKTKSSSIVILLCGSLTNKDIKAYNNAPGEVAIFKLMKFKNTLIQVGQEWKTKPFDATKINQSDFLDKAYQYIGSKQDFTLAFQKIHKDVSATQAISKPY